MGFSRPEYWSGQPVPSPGNLPDPGVEPRSPALQVDWLPAEPQANSKNTGVGGLSLLQRTFLTQEPNRGLLQVDSLSAELSGKPRVYEALDEIGSMAWPTMVVRLPAITQSHVSCMLANKSLGDTKLELMESFQPMQVGQREADIKAKWISSWEKRKAYIRVDMTGWREWWEVLCGWIPGWGGWKEDGLCELLWRCVALLRIGHRGARLGSTLRKGDYGILEEDGLGMK